MLIDFIREGVPPSNYIIYLYCNFLRD